eukprot:69902_1
MRKHMELQQKKTDINSYLDAFVTVLSNILLIITDLDPSDDTLKCLHFFFNVFIFNFNNSRYIASFSSSVISLSFSSSFTLVSSSFFLRLGFSFSLSVCFGAVSAAFSL